MFPESSREGGAEEAEPVRLPFVSTLGTLASAPDRNRGRVIYRRC